MLDGPFLLLEVIVTGIAVAVRVVILDGDLFPLPFVDLELYMFKKHTTLE